MLIHLLSILFGAISLGLLYIVATSKTALFVFFIFVGIGMAWAIGYHIVLILFGEHYVAEKRKKNRP